MRRLGWLLLLLLMGPALADDPKAPATPLRQARRDVNAVLHAAPAVERYLDVQRGLLAGLAYERLLPPRLTPDDVERLALLGTLYEHRVTTVFAGLALTRALADAEVTLDAIDAAWVVEHVSHEALRADSAAVVGVIGECSAARAAWALAAAQCDADGGAGRACRAARDGRVRLAPAMEPRVARSVLEIALFTGAPEQICGTSQLRAGRDAARAHAAAADQVLREVRSSECGT